MKKFRGVLFDFDGVIADSMDDNFKAWKKAFSDYDIKISEKNYFELEGYPTVQIAEIILKKAGKKIKPEVISNLKHHYYILNSTVKFYPFVKEILNLLIRRKISLAIVSGADRRKLKAGLKNLAKKFDVIISGDDKIKGKLAPDPYLQAAKKLSLNPNQCLVIENAPLGIESSKAAGC